MNRVAGPHRRHPARLMRSPFDAIADRLLAQAPDAAHDLALMTACVRMAQSFSSTGASTAPARLVQLMMTADEVVMSGVSPMSDTMLVCAPTCSAAVVARHVAASLAAGNRVELVLFESPTALLALLVTIVQEVISPLRFAVVCAETGWHMTGGDPTVIVLTETEAFMNDEPGEWIRDHSGQTAVTELIDFYTTPDAPSSAPIE